MPLFDEEEHEQQAPKKSWWSSIGDFLMKAVTVLAIVALAVVTLVTLSDTARDKLNDLTKDKKTGQGGWGDAIRGGAGTAKGKVGGMLGAAGEAAGNAISKVSETAGDLLKSGKDTAESAKNTVSNTVDAAEFAAYTATGLYAAKKVVGKYGSGALGTVNEKGEFENLPKKELKAVNKQRGYAEDLKTQETKKIEATKNAQELRAKADAAKEKMLAAEAKAKATNKFSLDRWKKGTEFYNSYNSYNDAEAAAQKAEKALVKIDKKITKLNKQMAANAENMPAKPVVTRGEHNAGKAAINPATTAEAASKATTAAPNARPQANTAQTANGNATEQPKPATQPQTQSHSTAPKPSGGPTLNTNPAGGLVEKLKTAAGAVKETAGKYIGKAGKLLRPAVVLDATKETMSHVSSGNLKEAGATALKAGAVLAGGELMIATDALEALANTSPIKDTIESGTAAYLNRKLSPSQQAAVNEWKVQAKELGLNVPETQIIRKVMEQNGLGDNPMPPNTPKTLHSNKEQSISTTKN